MTQHVESNRETFVTKPSVSKSCMNGSSVFVHLLKILKETIFQHITVQEFWVIRTHPQVRHLDW